jgi:molecular chaperone GrpE (heat shock protein)
MGRSTANNPNFADGIIVGVVRNGFIRGGREVIRQPEVIVNRLA